MTRARDVSKLLSTSNGKIAGSNLDVSFENITDTGTEGTRVATGTTAQRGTTQGQIRFNSTTGLAEYYNGTNFVNIEGTPVVNSVSPTSISTGTNPLPQNITITGVNFQSGATVTFIDSQAVATNSPSVTFTNSTSLVAQLPSSVSVADQPFDVRVNNPTGLTATLTDAVQLDALPTWTTSAGNIGTIVDIGNQSLSVSASDPDGGAVSYSETGGTVLSTAGLTLNSATGAITGDPNDLSTSSETKTFTLRATDNENNTTDRTFNIIINQALDGSSTARKAFSAQDLLDAGASTGTKYVDIGGVTVQMHYDSTDKFGNGVYGWLRFDSAFRNSYGSQLSPAAYATGGGNAASWTSNYQNWTIGNQTSQTSTTGIGHVRMRIPRLQYARIETLTGYNSGSQTADDGNVEGNSFYDANSGANHISYAINRTPTQPNTDGYPVSIYNTNLSNSYDLTNRSQGSTGNLIYAYPGGLFSTLGTTAKTVNDFNTVSYSTFDSNGVMFMSSWSGDSGSEQIDYSNFTMWVH